MLNSIRNFSKTIFAKILLFIVVIPFVFWGMGGVFNSGNTNSLAKINNVNVSTQDFIKHINELRIDNNTIRENLENNILEELLSELISKKILEIQVNELNINISEEALATQIKSNPNFFDENKKFSRLKYEKFLLSSNMEAFNFEKKLKERETQKDLFNYISGGIYSPSFLTNSTYQKETRKLDIKYINLNEKYKSFKNISLDEINEYISNNKESLKQIFFDYSFAKISPKDLFGIDEFNDNFFNIIDEIENKILSGVNFDEILNQYNLKKISKKNLVATNNLNEFEKKIVSKNIKNNIDLIDMGDFYYLYNIDKRDEKLPSLENIQFINIVKEKIFNEKKYNYNLNLLKKINSSNFNLADFNKVNTENNNNLKQMTLNSPRDNKKFNIDSVKALYSVPIGAFLLTTDNEDNVFLVNIISEQIDKISSKDKKLIEYANLSVANINKEILLSYDYLLNTKYKIKINYQTLDRVKNYFK